MALEKYTPAEDNTTETESTQEQEITPEEIVADFEAILQKLLTSSTINMRDLIVLKRTINNKQIPDEDSLANFPEVSPDVTALKEKAVKLGEDQIPWSKLKQAIADAQTQY
ncbi:hypothetical protein HOB10_04395 [Candidatus Parcubacteria bacterium]|jgi:hypothetical protein|nr:hypothetical protein [Candidatus Parcubacteria bacterium]